MVTLADTTSTSQFRRRFLRTGLQNFRAQVNDQRAMINNQKNGIPFNLLIVPWPLGIERSAAHPHSSNSQLLTSSFSLSYDYKRLLCETDAVGGAISQTYASDTTEEFGDLIGEDGQYIHQYDAQANTNALLDDTGTVQAQYKYFAFGQVSAVSIDGGSWTAEDWQSLPLDFTSNMLAGGKKQYYLDQEIALYLLGSGNNGRYYDANTGRFLSEDPTGEAGGDDNLFRYTGNDPVNNLDPSGHVSKHQPPPPKPPSTTTFHPPQTQASQNPNSAVPANTQANAHQLAAPDRHTANSGQSHEPDLLHDPALLAKLHGTLEQQDPHPLASSNQPFSGGSSWLWLKSFISNAYWQSGTPLLNAETSAVQGVEHPIESYQSAVNSTASVMAQNLEDKGSTLGTLGVGLSYEVNSAIGTGQVLQGVYGVNLVTHENLTSMQKAQYIIGGTGQIGLTIAGAAKGLDVEGKPPLPRAAADVRGVPRFTPSVPGHVAAAGAEEELAKTVHSLPDEQVVHWGEPIGVNGEDVLSVNRKTGDVTFWDAKFRSAVTRIQESPTFKAGSTARAKAIKNATEVIESDRYLPSAIRKKALDNLENNRIQSRTVGFGSAKNSVIGK